MAAAEAVLSHVREKAAQLDPSEEEMFTRRTYLHGLGAV
jgi:hypothetical protein